MRCPNCNYSLVLLPKRAKYKCPRCSRLFLQSEIERKEFVYFNKRERQKDREALAEKKGKQVKLTEFEKKQRANESQVKWKENHPDYNSEKCKQYYSKNKTKILSKQKEYRIKSGKQIKERLKSKKIQNLEESRLMERIKYWRNQQKELALLYIENEEIRAYKPKFEGRFPTLALS